MKTRPCESPVSPPWDARQLAELLGVPWEPVSELTETTQLQGGGVLHREPDMTGELQDDLGGAGCVEVSQMVDEAHRELLTATEMTDAKRQRIIAKTIRWLQFLEQRAQSLTENVRALVNRLAIDARVSQLASNQDRAGETTERLEWALTAVTRWIERRLPLAQRRKSGARLNVDWTVAGARTWWAEAQAAEPFLLRDLVRECLLLDGKFPGEDAEPIADRILEDLRQGNLWLPRLTRCEESTSELSVLSYEARSSRVQSPLVPRTDEGAQKSASVEQLGYFYSMAVDDPLTGIVRNVPKWQQELEFTETMPEVAAAYDRSIVEENTLLRSVGMREGRMGHIRCIGPAGLERGPVDFLSSPVPDMVPIGYKLVEGGFIQSSSPASRNSVAALSSRLAVRYGRRPCDVARRLRRIARVKLRTATTRGDIATAQRYLDAINGIQQFIAEQNS